MSSPVMDPDMETQPLLNPQSAVQKRKSSKRPIIAVIVGLILAVLIGSVLISQIPSSQVVIDNALQVSNYKVSQVYVNGWQSSGKVLQLTANVDFWMDYDEWMSNNDTQLSPWQRRLGQFSSERVMQTACFDLNNVTTYDPNGTLAYVHVQEPICVDLRNKQITPLKLTIFVEPRISNILKVVKKLIQHKYDDLHLSSNVDVRLSKHIGIFHLPLGTLHNLKIHWDQLTYTQGLSSLLESFVDLTNQISIRKFTIRDSTDGFGVDMAADPLSIPPEFKWLDWQQDDVIPYISWEVKVPDCDGECTIKLPTLSCLSDRFAVRNPMNLSAFTDIKGPLPQELLSQVCWSDGENAATPITNLLNRLINSSELVTMQVRGHPIKVAQDADLLVPFDILEAAFAELSFFPVTTNFTIDSKNLFEKVTIEGLRIRWVTGRRLTVAGRIVGLVSLPFYETTEQQIFVNHIKGTTKLYHDGIHFLTVPMRVWSPSSSQILHNDKNQTVLKLLLDIRDDEVQIKDSVELTRVFNEILVKGRALVDVSSKLDLLVSTHLGEIVLLGLKGQGSAAVRS